MKRKQSQQRKTHTAKKAKPHAPELRLPALKPHPFTLQLAADELAFALGSDAAKRLAQRVADCEAKEEDHAILTNVLGKEDAQRFGEALRVLRTDASGHALVNGGRRWRM